MTLPVTITGISSTVNPVGPFLGTPPGTAYAQSLNSAGLSDANNLWGDATSRIGMAQKITTGSAVTIATASFSLKKFGSPTDNLTALIVASDGTTVLATSATVAGSSLTTSYAWVNFTFSTPYALSASTIYYIVITRSGAADASNYYLLDWSTDNVYTGGELHTYSTASGVGNSQGTSTDALFKISTAGSSAFYFFAVDGTTATTLQAYKSTAPTSSWSSVTTKTGFTTGIQWISGFQVGNIIHLCITDGATTSVNFKYLTFDISSDTFGTVETITSALNTQTNALINAYTNSIIVRSDGSVVVLHQGARVVSMSNSYSRTVYSRRSTGGVWTTNTAVDAGGAFDGIVFDAILGTSDIIHFIFSAASGTAAQRALSSANVLQTQSTATTFLYSTPGPVCTSTSYLSTNQRIVFAHGTSVNQTVITPQGMRFDSALTPTVTGTSTGGTNSGSIRLFNDSGNVYAYYGLGSTTLSVKTSTDNGATWGSGTLDYTGTTSVSIISHDARAVYQSGNSIVFPYIMNDNGTLKYNEYTIRTLGISGTSSITEDSDTVASATTIAIKATSTPTEADDTLSSASHNSNPNTASSSSGEYNFPTTIDTTLLVGYNASNIGAAQTFTPSKQLVVDSCVVRLAKQGSPTDNLYVELRDATGATVLATSSTVAGSTLTITATNTTFTFPSPITANAGTTYMLLVSRSGATDTVNYYFASGQFNGTYPNGSASIYTGGTSYTGTPSDLYFSVGNSGQFIVEADDATSSTATIAIKANASITEANDTVTAVIQVTPIAGTASITEANDTVSSASTISITASGAISEAGDTVASTSTISIKGTASITEANDTVASTSTIALKASASITEAGDTVVSPSTLAIKAAASITEANDTVSSTATIPIKANGVTSDADDTLSSTATISIKANESVSEANDTLSSTATISIVANKPKGFFVTNSGDNSFNWTGSAYVVPDGSLIIAGAFDFPWTSSDKGVSWTQQTNLSGQSYLFGSNYDGSILIAPLSFGDIYKSTNRGVTWSATGASTFAELTGNWQAVGMSNDGSVIIAGERNGTTGSHPVISYNQGSTWASLTAAGVRTWVDFALSSDGSVIYGLTLTGLWKSTNSGVSWTQVTTIPSPGPNGNSAYKDIDCSVDGQTIAVTARSATTPVADTYLYSTNGGTTWTSKTLTSPSELHYLSLSDDGSIQYLSGGDGTFAAVYQSTDHFTTFTALTPPNTYNGQYWEVSCSADGKFVTALDYNDYNIVAYDSSTPVITEANDTSSSTATIAIKANASITEDSDTLSATSVLTSGRSADAAITEANDTVSSTAALPIKATSSVTEADDSLGSATKVAIAGAVASTEANDSVSSTGASPIHAVAALSEADDTVSAVGFVPPQVATVNITEANDTVSSASTITLKASASITEANDTVSAVGFVPPQVATANITEANDTFTSVATLPLKATASITEADDTLAAAAGIVLGILNVTEGDDTVSSTATLLIKDVAGIVEADDAVSSPATLLIKGTSNLQESGDTVSASSVISIKTSASIAEANDTVSATGAIAIKASASITEGSDTESSASAIAVHGSASIGEADDGLVSATRLIIQAALSAIENDDNVSSSTAISIRAFGDLVEDNDNIDGTSTLSISGSASIVEDDDNDEDTASLRIQAFANIAEENDLVDAFGLHAELEGVLVCIEQNDTVIAIARYVQSNRLSYDDYLRTFTKGIKVPGYTKNSNTTLGVIGNTTNDDNNFSYDKYLNKFIKR
jgi:hypothetical protein